MKDLTFVKNNNGLTLVEAVVAIAMIAIISVGMTTLLFSLSKTSKMAEEQLKQNAIYRVIKENVVDSARKDNNIHGNDCKAANSVDTAYTSLKVEDRTGKVYPEYVFDLLYVTSEDFGDMGKLVDRYKITIKNRNSDILTEFIAEIYP